MPERKINVDYISRVEGQGGIDLYVTRDGELRDAKVRIFEPPRFFEAFMVGRKYDELMELAARICGICPVSHEISALRAVEDALGVEVSEATKRVRKLMAMSALISSHVLSVYFLTLPDYFGGRDLIEVAGQNPGLLKRGLELKRLGNDLTELIGGRSVHPVTAIVGGFTNSISKGDADAIRKRFIEAKSDALKTVHLFKGLEMPKFTRKCEHMAISSSEEYAINEGQLASTEGIKVPQREYRRLVKENQVQHSNAKHSNVKGRTSYLVGPLARVNINFDQLSPDARRAAKSAGLNVPNYSPFKSPLARAVEVVHCIDECIEILETMPYGEEASPIKLRAGDGYAITEAPRGINYHHYSLNRNGITTRADIVPPTCQNYRNMEMDLMELVPPILDLQDDEIAHKCQMLIRTYDPCISCSVHAIKIHRIK
jgi:coenzyme F420-reducing hydrogenase alpha subunit